jgi:hypothetical protein
MGGTLGTVRMKTPHQPRRAPRPGKSLRFALPQQVRRHGLPEPGVRVVADLLPHGLKSRVHHALILPAFAAKIMESDRIFSCVAQEGQFPQKCLPLLLPLTVRKAPLFSPQEMIVMTALLLIVAASITGAETHYVAADGKAENDGSRERPWPSAEFALAKVGGGGTIVFRPGVYRGPIWIARAYAGNRQHPTVIRSEEKWKAVVIGAPVHGIANGDHCDWLTIDGFEVLGARFDGIKLSGDHDTVRNCWVHHNTQMGIAMHGVRYGVIENNLIEFNGCHVQFDHGVYADGDGLTVHGNIVRHNAGFGLHLYPSLQNALVAHNLVYGQPLHSGVIVVRGEGGPNRIVHNTIFARGAALDIWNGDGEEVGNNILVGGGDPISLYDCKRVQADYNLCWPKSAHDGPHGVAAAPQLFGVTEGLFWLTQGSPAIGKGSSRYSLAADFWGRPTAKDKTPDLGAFAFVPLLLDPRSRAGWNHGWAYGYSPTRQPADMPDLWVLPKESDAANK